MRKSIIAIISFVVILLSLWAYQKYGDHGGVGAGVEVDWRLLGDLDYVTGHTSSELKALDGQKVKMPGFMVPLEDNQKAVKEFLLVPSPQACIHVPPPPPNQMVYVRMQNDHSEVAFGPIWVYGTLKIAPQKSMYGEASYELLGDAIEPYK